MKTFDLVLCGRDESIARSLIRQLRQVGFGVRAAGRKDIRVLTCYDPLGESPELPRGFTKKDILAW